MPLVVVTHPIALNDNNAIRQKADNALDDVVRTLISENAKSLAEGGCQ